MDLTNLIRSASLVVFFIMAVIAERKLWLTFDIIASAGFGAAFLVFPNALVEFQVVGNLDAVHLSLSRVYGMTLLCSSFVWFITRETRDGTVPISLMMSRVLSTSLMLFVQIMSLWGPSKASVVWTEQFIWFGILGTVLWLAGHLVHLCRSCDFSTYPQHNIRLNNHLRVDSWLMFIHSFALVAFPSFLCQHLYNHKANTVHLHIIRCIGCLGFGDAVISMQAPGFLHERDKRAQLCARILWSLLITSPWIASALLFKIVSLDALLNITIIYLIPLINAMLGYFTEANTIYYVPNKNKSN